MKWFRRFPGVTWLPGDRSVEENAETVMDLREERRVAGQGIS